MLGYSNGEAAAILGTSETAIKGALQRARASLGQRSTKAHSERTTAPDSPQERDVIRRFTEAFSNDDIKGVIELLTDDAWLAMPPAPHEYHGPAAIGAFLRASATWCGHRRFRLVLTRANTQPAFGCYLTDGDTPTTPCTP